MAVRELVIIDEPQLAQKLEGVVMSWFQGRLGFVSGAGLIVPLGRGVVVDAGTPELAL